MMMVKKNIKNILIVSLGLTVLLGLLWYIGSTGSFIVKTDEGYLVYSEPVEGPEDCTSLETYDPEMKACVFVCASETECNQIQERIDTMLDAWAEEYEEFSESLRGKEKKLSVETQVGVEARYDVLAGERLALSNGEEQAIHREAWRLFAALSPDWMTDAFVHKFLVYHDAEDDTLAYVADEEGKFELAINRGQYEGDSERDRVLTLIHEFAHILTLNTTQVDKDVTETECTTVFLPDTGCAHAGAYIDRFVQSFWPDAERTAVVGGSADLYALRPSAFVTEYAASSVEEDIAESFVVYVIRAVIPSGTTVAEQKTAYFTQFSELVTLRADIRKALAPYILK